MHTCTITSGPSLFNILQHRRSLYPYSTLHKSSTFTVTAYQVSQLVAPGAEVSSTYVNITNCILPGILDERQLPARSTSSLQTRWAFSRIGLQVLRERALPYSVAARPLVTASKSTAHLVRLRRSSYHIFSLPLREIGTVKISKHLHQHT